MFVAQLAAAALDTTVEKLDATKAATRRSSSRRRGSCSAARRPTSRARRSTRAWRPRWSARLPNYRRRRRSTCSTARRCVGQDGARALQARRLAVADARVRGERAAPLQITPALMAKVKGKSALFPNVRQQAAALAHIVKVKSGEGVADEDGAPDVALPQAAALRGAAAARRDAHARQRRRQRDAPRVPLGRLRDDQPRALRFSLASKLPEADAKMPQLFNAALDAEQGRQEEGARSEGDARRLRRRRARVPLQDDGRRPRHGRPQARAADPLAQQKAKSKATAGAAAAAAAAAVGRARRARSGGGRQLRRRRQQERRRGAAAGKSGGGGEEDAAQQRESEVEKRRRMAAEEEAVAGMFADADDDDLGGDDDEAEAVDFDDDDEGEVEFDGGDDGSTTVATTSFRRSSALGVRVTGFTTLTCPTLQSAQSSGSRAGRRT